MNGNRIDFNLLDGILDRVEKPARYTGGELNQIVKEGEMFRFALCFPDVYEIGMSHLGSRILYNVLNGNERIACERAYTPWPDMEKELRGAGLPVFSLETRRPLQEFDVIGFSLLYEMCYTNILTVLELCGIPFRSEDRSEAAPLIVCGGPCACNPEPIAPFMDACMIGDGEEMILELAERIRTGRETGKARREILRDLSGIPGVYVPSLYRPDGAGRLIPSEGAPARIERRFVRDLDRAPYIGKQVVPYMSITHDRASVEVMRGCSRGCRFCQAGHIYRPVRERKK